ncbi:PAS domain-containing protein [Haloferula sp. A504]|uniref:PAS domain-containing protein n=1 Tax=Haloferula sp. A504 TaxID=3373601 RepID=UPI0031C41E3C|nr:PAS domain-containing protein [Verrucomicrobiaceae bacterium E54]
MNTRLSDLLWEHDPNGLLVVNRRLEVHMVNQAFCRFFKTTREEILGRPAAELIGDVSDFEQAFEVGGEIRRSEHTHREFDLRLHRLVFTVPEEDKVAAIFVDLTREWKQRRQLVELREKLAKDVRDVVDRQMSVAQEIAGLLGEATATTKVALLRLLDSIERERE